MLNDYAIGSAINNTIIMIKIFKIMNRLKQLQWP